MTWFDVDKSGLAAQLERRGKAFAVFELIQNAWDSGSPGVHVQISPMPGEPYAVLAVEDFSAEGFINLDHAFTMFARSSRAADPEKRGRFNLGEKLVLALCRKAIISSTTGTVTFSADGRRRTAQRRDVGTMFAGEIRMTREELADVEHELLRLIPPIPTTINGRQLEAPKPITTIELRLPIELEAETAAGEKVLKRSTRIGKVEIYRAFGAGGPEAGGEILEMGIPIVDAPIGYTVNVLQKIPLNMDRDNVTPEFLRTLRVGVVNAMAGQLDEETAAAPWVSEAVADSRIQKPAFDAIIAKRFGERAVVAVPGDPIANAQAEAAGFSVIHGGALAAGAWANARKFESIPPSSKVFPTPKAQTLADRRICETCKRPI